MIYYRKDLVGKIAKTVLLTVVCYISFGVAVLVLFGVGLLFFAYVLLPIVMIFYIYRVINIWRSRI